MLTDRRSHHGRRRQQGRKDHCRNSEIARYNCYTDISELPKHRFDEIRHFFEVYKILENDKRTIVNEFQNREAAEEIIQTCIEEYVRRFQM